MSKAGLGLLLGGVVSTIKTLVRKLGRESVLHIECVAAHNLLLSSCSKISMAQSDKPATTWYRLSQFAIFSITWQK